ncbi:S8 family serine peptidase [Virgibacillus proomii]|uniref:S8 family serine peptidase n=1 Tax=Virgibacillus proomii TaxID=84407 RepID=UPI00209D7AFC|nr:S8 family serine peptidase [Virgibacillus proomii]
MDIRKNYNINGQGIKIGLIDTGISNKGFATDGINLIDNNKDFTDHHCHGTHISGILKDEKYGVAPSADLYVVKALDKNLNGKIKDIANGVEWLIDKNTDIILLPLGTSENSKELRNVISKANESNILVVSSIGNYGLNIEVEVLYPAKYKDVIGVGALSANGEIWSGTTLGQGLDILLPGQRVKSLSLEGETLLASGTSMASAYMAGFLALYLEHYNYFDRHEIKEQFFRQMNRLPLINKVRKMETEIFIKK